MIYVTHDQVEAMTLADRIVVLNAGRIEQVGTPLELYRHPDNLFVAGFIGSPKMNFLPVLVEPVDGRSAIRGANGKTIGSPVGGFHGRATLGIRPESLRVCSPDEGFIAAELQLEEHLGEHRLMSRGDHGGHPARREDAGRRPLSRERPASFHLCVGEMHLFGPEGWNLMKPSKESIPNA